MKTTEIIEICDILKTEYHNAHASHSIALNEWHEREAQLKPTESSFDEALFHECRHTNERLDKASEALDAFMNHDWH